MSKQLIGIEIAHNTLRIAILSQEKGRTSVTSMLGRDYAGTGELATLLQELLVGAFRIGDQLVTSLPARMAYVRRLEFPFQDDKKIAAAIPFTLSAQLPVTIDQCAAAMQPAQPVGKGATVEVAAVPKATLQSLLDPFEEAGVPLHLVDLAPFCHVAGLGEQIGDGLLICATGQEITVSLVQNGNLADYRILPAIAGSFPAGQPLQQLLREIGVLKRAAGAENLPVLLMGEGSTPALAETLQAAGLQVEMLALELDGQMVNSAFLPAVALALRGRVARHDRSFNFRRGEYALKGEWANLKRKLVLLAALLGMTIVIMLGSMTLKYGDLARRADLLQVEMVDVYRSLFPAATTIVDVPLQLKSAIRDLQEKGNLVTGGQASALAILKEISSLPALVSVEIQELVLSAAELKLTGRTVSFEAVNQMARVLGESPIFTKVQVTDAKMSLDGSRIDFRLSLSLANSRSEQ